MTSGPPWVDDANAALLTDLYQLTMLQAYLEAAMFDEAVFDLFIRRLPQPRNYLIACGLDDVLHYLETVSFDAEALDYLESLGRFSKDFLHWLGEFRFTGEVYAMPEGTPLFANEPILEIVAPLPQAQLIETFLLNQIQFQTLIASKASRVVFAAAGRTVIDFGLRRMHGTDAAMRAARAFFVVGIDDTSNVLAAKTYGMQPVGTMAHSYIEAHDDELTAFRVFADTFADATLLVDTYDTLQGVRNVIRLAGELGKDFKIRAIRLDSGDLAQLAKDARRLLDEADLPHVEIFASGNLDEYAIANLVAAQAPIAGFGVGTRMGVSADVPYLDSAYKLASYAGRARMKLSVGKGNLPGPKQVFRITSDGEASHDVIALHDEKLDGQPLLVKVMEAGRRLPAGQRTLGQIRAHCNEAMSALPPRLRALEPADPPYLVKLSQTLQDELDRLRRDLEPIQR